MSVLRVLKCRYFGTGGVFRTVGFLEVMKNSTFFRASFPAWFGLICRPAWPQWSSSSLQTRRANRRSGCEGGTYTPIVLFPPLEQAPGCSETVLASYFPTGNRRKTVRLGMILQMRENRFCEFLKCFEYKTFKITSGN